MQIFWLFDAAQDSAYYKWKTVCHALAFALTCTISECTRRRYFVSANLLHGHAYNTVPTTGMSKASDGNF